MGLKASFEFVQIIKNFLFPVNCALCDNTLINPNEIKYNICLECKEKIKPIEGEKCIICGKPLVSEINTCLSCRNQNERSYDKLWTLFPYTGKYRELLTQYKFHKKLGIVNLFIDNLSQILSQDCLTEAFIVPVPPRPGKIKNAGWDQVDYLVKKLKKPVSRCLERKKSKIQKELNREQRINNLKGRILCCKPPPKIALIIDDVITTGSTMEICARVLKNAGCEKVYGISLFYD